MAPEEYLDSPLHWTQATIALTLQQDVYNVPHAEAELIHVLPHILVHGTTAGSRGLGLRLWSACSWSRTLPDAFFPLCSMAAKDRKRAGQYKDLRRNDLFVQYVQNL